MIEYIIGGAIGLFGGGFISYFVWDKSLKSKKVKLISEAQNEGEVIKKDSPAKCCTDLTLIPPTDDRTDIFGSCLKTCYQDVDCGSEKSCQLSKTNQLVCLPKSIRDQDVEKLKQDIKQIKQDQNFIQSSLDSIINFLKKLFGFKNRY